MSKDAAAAPAEVASRIFVVRGQRILLDMDLAALYGVTVRRLNEQVRRNGERFPEGFVHALTNQEVANLKSQFATSSWGGRRKAPLAFTEHGAIMAATVLNSPRAVQMTIYVVRAFVKMRESLAAHTQLARELTMLKGRVDTLDTETRKQFDLVYEAILGLMSPAAKKQ
jgi:hypothetical protein